MNAFTSLRVFRGRTVEIVVTVTAWPADVDFSEAVYVCSLKNSRSDADSAAVVRKSTGSGISFLDASRRKVLIEIPPNETAGLSLNTPIFMDVVLKLSPTSVHTVVDGTITFQETVTINP